MNIKDIQPENRQDHFTIFIEMFCKKDYQWISCKITISRDVSLTTAAAEVKCSQDLSSVQYQIEILDRLDVPPPGAAGRNLAGVRARWRQE